MKATLGGGCFWCLEAVFQDAIGIQSVESGYSGGEQREVSSELVYSEVTNHAEVVQLEYDPELISYPEILAIFFEIHDPTTLNRQGYDIGKHYRSCIFYHSSEQQDQAIRCVEAINHSGKYQNPVVTEIVPFTFFVPAEEYHQQFYKNNPSHPYCVSVANPKVVKAKAAFKKFFRSES